MSDLAPVKNYVDALVHPTARDDALTETRHRAFIAPRLVGGLIALAGFPVYLALRGIPSALDLGVFAWLVAQLLIAYVLSHTGRYAAASLLSVASLFGLAAATAWHAGSFDPLAAVWLIMMPFEAALSGSRRLIAWACALASAGAAVMAVFGAFHVPHVAAADAVVASSALAVGAAFAHAAALGLAAQALVRAGSRLLAAEEDRRRLLACNATEVVTRHGGNGVVLFVSPAAERMLGLRADALTGHGLFDRVHVADRPAYLKALADAANGTPGIVEFRLRRDDDDGRGRFVWIEMRCRPLDQGRAGPPAGRREPGEAVAVLRDISERKRLEEALAQARAECERASLAKTHFLATMSHELRTPLNAIIGFSDMLLARDREIEPAGRIEYARLINEAGRHLLAVVNDILDMSKLETGNFEISPDCFAPADAIIGCCNLFMLKAQRAGVALEVRIAELPEIVADRRAFTQILINLIANAVKFTPAGGRVTVSAACEGAKLVMSIEDNGVGIAQDDLPRLGEAFFQARASYDRRHDGTGLGLSIVKGLLRLHGGDMRIESRLGEGTRVRVTLPIDCRKVAVSEPAAVPASRAAASERIPSPRVKQRA
ncbi:MAG: PAS domain S-box protein [Pseudolabrys sp.]|nr:PAS domain S-box protein [Pseudolabrys sp.]